MLGDDVKGGRLDDAGLQNKMLHNQNLVKDVNKN